MDEELILSTDPFDGDFGGAGDNDGVLTDKMVTCRKARECHTCAEQTTPGTRIRVRSEVYDGEFMRFTWCHNCCAVMAYEPTGEEDGLDPYEKRIEMGKAARIAVLENK